MVLCELHIVKLLYNENLTLLITTAFSFTLTNNQLSTSLIFLSPAALPDVVSLFHSIKADYIESVFWMMRSVFLHFSDTKMVEANAILSSPTLIPSLINALSELFSKVPYHQIK
jgi:hypothetical protein